MKLIITKTLKPTLLAASLVLAFPAIAAEALSGSYETINTPDGFTMSTGDTVISEDGKFVTGGSMQDMNGATLILKSENASIKTGGRFFMGSGATIKSGENADLVNLDFVGGNIVLSGATLNVDGTMSYYSEGGVGGSYIEVVDDGQLTVDHLVSTSYYTLNVSHNGLGGTATIRELEAPGLVAVEKNGVLNIGEKATIGHFWNYGGTVNAQNAVMEISPREDMMPQDYDGTTFVYEDGKTYVFGNGIDKSQGEGDKEVGTMNVGTLIVHGNALNADNSTLNATVVAVDEALKNETGANINVTDGSVSAKTIDGAQGNINAVNSTVTAAESSDFGNVTANRSSVEVGSGDYSFEKFAGEDKSIVLNDLSANVTINQKEGALNLIATGEANDNYVSAQESVDRIQEVLTVNSGSQAGDVYLLTQGVVNDGARIVFDEQGNPVITYIRNTNLENFGALSALSIVNWRNELNSLSKRMGELRDSPAGVGTWVRLYGSENELGSVTAKNTTIQIGSDYSIGDWKVGAAVNYTDGDADFAGGEGDNENYGFALYGVWLSESGQFVDLMAKYSRLSQDFRMGGMDGSYDNNAFALSVEYGWRFDLGSVAFVEPQAAFTYSRIEGDSFEASGAEIDQDDYDSYIGRVGIRGGFKFPENKGTLYARVSYLYDFDGEMNATARAVHGTGVNSMYEDLGGSWIEYGVGGNFNLTDRTYTYVDLERNSGGEIKENWRWNIGLRHVF